MGDVEGIHEGWALQQRQGKSVSVGWVGYKATYANRVSELLCPHRLVQSAECRMVRQVCAKSNLSILERSNSCEGCKAVHTG